MDPKQFNQLNYLSLEGKQNKFLTSRYLSVELNKHFGWAQRWLVSILDCSRLVLNNGQLQPINTLIQQIPFLRVGHTSCFPNLTKQQLICFIAFHVAFLVYIATTNIHTCTVYKPKTKTREVEGDLFRKRLPKINSCTLSPSTLECEAVTPPLSSAILFSAEPLPQECHLFNRARNRRPP